MKCACICKDNDQRKYLFIFAVTSVFMKDFLLAEFPKWSVVWCCMVLYGINRKVSYRLQIYVNSKQYVVGSIRPCLNCASAVKNYGATKLMEVCRACGVCEPGAFDGPDTNGENCKFQD